MSLFTSVTFILTTAYVERKSHEYNEFVFEIPLRETVKELEGQCRALWPAGQWRAIGLQLYPNDPAQLIVLHYCRL